MNMIIAALSAAATAKVDYITSREKAALCEVGEFLCELADAINCCFSFSLIVTVFSGIFCLVLILSPDVVEKTVQRTKRCFIVINGLCFVMQFIAVVMFPVTYDNAFSTENFFRARDDDDTAYENRVSFWALTFISMFINLLLLWSGFLMNNSRPAYQHLPDGNFVGQGNMQQGNYGGVGYQQQGFQGPYPGGQAFQQQRFFNGPMNQPAPVLQYQSQPAQPQPAQPQPAQPQPVQPQPAQPQPVQPQPAQPEPEAAAQPAQPEPEAAAQPSDEPDSESKPAPNEPSDESEPNSGEAIVQEETVEKVLWKESKK